MTPNKKEREIIEKALKQITTKIKKEVIAIVAKHGEAQCWEDHDCLEEICLEIEKLFGEPKTEKKMVIDKAQTEEEELETLLLQHDGLKVCSCGAPATMREGLCLSCYGRKRYLLKKKNKNSDINYYGHIKCKQCNHFRKSVREIGGICSDCARTNKMNKGKEKFMFSPYR